MCMLFVKPKNLLLPENYHESLWRKNPHGLSVWNKSSKTLFKTIDKNQAYKYLIDNAKSELVVHYRLGTSGKNTIEQLHGFDIVNENYCFFHNGVLNTFFGNDELSDTQNLVSYFNENNFDLYEIIQYLEKHEKSSRFLIVNKKTNEIHKPACAQWNSATMIDEHEVVFSNSYAIDYYLLNNHDNHDNNDDYLFYDSDDYLHDEYLAELDFLIYNSSDRDLLYFIQCNPEVVLKYLREFK